MIKISVIIPAYNAEKTLAVCLRSLEQQGQATDYEIIVADDGSQDRTPEIVREFSAVRYFHQANQGAARARNFGVEQARGEIVVFIDSDCEADPHWLAEMTRPFVDPEIMGVKGAYLSRQLESTARVVQAEYENKYEKMAKEKTIDFIDTYSAAFRRQTFLAMGGYDIAFPKASVEDQEFSFRLARQGCKMVFNPQARVYHLHSRTPGEYFRKKFNIGFWKNRVLQLHPGKIFNDSHTPQILKAQMLLTWLGLGMLAGNGLLRLPWVWLAGLGLLALASLLAGVEMRRIVRKNIFLGIFAVGLMLLRSLALGAGLIWGQIRGKQGGL